MFYGRRTERGVEGKIKSDVVQILSNGSRTDEEVGERHKLTLCIYCIMAGEQRGIGGEDKCDTV